MSNSTYTSIQVNDFGPIWRGEVEIRPLTVFTGAGNTGKSSLATLVYALTRHSLNSRKRSISDEFYDDIEDTFSNSIATDLKPDEPRENVRIPVSDMLPADSGHLGPKRPKELEIGIATTFGFQEIKQAISWKSNQGASIRVVAPADGASERSSVMSIKIGKRSFRYTSQHPETINLSKLTQKERIHFKRLQRLGEEDHHDGDSIDTDSRTAKFLYAVLNDRFFSFEKTLYLPASRVGLMDSFRTIVSSSLQGELDNVTIGSIQSRPLSGVLADFLQMLTAVNPSANNRLHRSVASRLEEELLHGTIEVVLNQVNFPYFFFKPVDNEQLIPLNLCSAMISQLAPLVVFLKELPRRNNLVIIEEPEAPLHPLQQVRFLQEISKWVRDGNYIVLTTHSEWITEALSNLVIENKRNPNAGINVYDTGLWRFIEGSKGSEIKEAVWNLDAGGYDDGFEEVGDELLNEWTWYKKELL